MGAGEGDRLTVSSGDAYVEAQTVLSHSDQCCTQKGQWNYLSGRATQPWMGPQAPQLGLQGQLTKTHCRFLLD